MGIDTGRMIARAILALGIVFAANRAGRAKVRGSVVDQYMWLACGVTLLVSLIDLAFSDG